MRWEGRPMLEIREVPSAHLGTPVRVFDNGASFLRHVQKHVLGPAERPAWAQVLPVDRPPWTQLAGVTIDGVPQGPLRAAYDAVVERVAAGIAFAEAQPIILRIDDTIHTWDETRLRSTTWFLAGEGYFVAVRGGTVRTVLMDEDSGKLDGRWARFAHAVSVLRKRGLAAEQRARRYLPEENAWATARSVAWHVRENFTNGCNPWPRPKRSRPGPAGPDTPDKAAYLAHVGTYCQ
jgi:hypothetical protein